MAYWPNFEVWEGEEATDNAFDYARRYDLDIEQRYALLHAACNDGFVECERGDPISFFFPVHEDGKEKGRVEMSPYQLPGDAVYDYCKREKYLQPKYTKMHVRANLHETFCAALEQDRGLTEAQRISCESGPRTAREPRFVQEFTVSELKYKMPFYDSEFPPCDGRPGPDGLLPEDPLTAENWTVGCVPRELRAGEAFCGRVHPYPPGCGPHMAEFIATSLARAERRRFQMTSPFGYDYYLSLATLRDADNDTLVDAYLAGMAPVAGMLSETLRNLTELNETLKASRETHLHARRALAHARGARRVATEALYDAEYRLKSLRDAVSSAFVEAGSFVSQKRLSPADAVRDAAILFPPIPPTLRGSRKALEEAIDDTNRADELLHAGDLLLDDAQILHGHSRPQADHLETMSRVFREGYETLTDKKRRETHDKPCKKIFGACCAKDTDNGGKDIKCGGDFENAE